MNLSLKSFLLEYYTSNDEEYKKALLDYYKDKEFINELLSYDRQSSSHYGKSKIESSGNILIKYIENNDYVIIQGMISKTGKLNRNDVSDMREWLVKLEMSIQNGKTLLTSVNNFSGPFIEKLLRNNPSFNVEEMGKMSNQYGTWRTIKINNF